MAQPIRPLLVWAIMRAANSLWRRRSSGLSIAAQGVANLGLALRRRGVGRSWQSWVEFTSLTHYGFSANH